MSRIGKQPIPVPANVQVTLNNGEIVVKGKESQLNFRFHPKMKVNFDEGQREIQVSRPDDSRSSKALHGLTRSLISNMVKGVVTPFEKRLEVHGVGYNANLKGQILELQVGFANTVGLSVPKGVKCEVLKNNEIVLTSSDKQAVGQFAAIIRKVRPPEPYKGKGIRYKGEQIRRKAGKAEGGK